MMNDISYRILTPSKLEVQYKEKRLLLTGEATTAPMFYADISSIKNWEPPHENISVTDAEKREIIRVVTAKSKESKVPIIFD